MFESFKNWYNKKYVEPHISCFVRGLVYDISNNPDRWSYDFEKYSLINKEDKMQIDFCWMDDGASIYGLDLHYQESKLLYKTFLRFRQLSKKIKKSKAKTNLMPSIEKYEKIGCPDNK